MYIQSVVDGLVGQVICCCRKVRTKRPNDVVAVYRTETDAPIVSYVAAEKGEAVEYCSMEGKHVDLTKSSHSTILPRLLFGCWELHLALADWTP